MTGMGRSGANLKGGVMDELTTEQEVQFREELDAIHDRITTIDALTSFLVGLKLGGQQRPRVARIVKATAHARAYLPDTGKSISTYDAERATAFATVAIAEACALVLERALAAREPLMGQSETRRRSNGIV